MKKLLYGLLALCVAAPAAAQTGGTLSGAQTVQGTGDVNRGAPVNVRIVSCPQPANSAVACTEASGGASPSATAGGASPSTVSPAAGTDGTNTRTLRTDSQGGLVPSQGVVASTRTVLGASSATSLSAASTTRIGVVVQLETALTANLHLCTTQAGACSATSYDFLIPSGAGAGTTYTLLFAPRTAIFGFSTAGATLVVNSWTAP